MRKSLIHKITKEPAPEAQTERPCDSGLCCVLLVPEIPADYSVGVRNLGKARVDPGLEPLAPCPALSFFRSCWTGTPTNVRLPSPGKKNTFAMPCDMPHLLLHPRCPCQAEILKRPVVQEMVRRPGDVRGISKLSHLYVKTARMLDEVKGEAGEEDGAGQESIPWIR